MARTFGTIIDRENGKHLGRYRKNGKTYYTPTVSTRAQVRTDLREIQKAIDRGEWTPPAPRTVGRKPKNTITLNDWVQIWYRLCEKDRLSPNTLRSYESVLRVRVLPTLGNIPLVDITTQDIKKLYDQLPKKYAPNTVKNTVLVFSTCMARAEKEGVIDASPIELEGAMRKRTKTRQPIAITANQLRKLIDCAAPDFRAAFALAGWGALRYGEVAALTRQDIDFTAGTVTINKSVKRQKGGHLVVGPPKSQAGYRTISLPDEAVDVLRAHLAKYTPPTPDSLVFYRSSHPLGFLTDRVIRRHLQDKCKEIGLPRMWFHDLRHTALTLYGQAGATLADLMHRAGHSDAKTVMIYQHSTLKRDQELTNRMVA